MDYLLHILIGALAALTGVYARGFCTHRRHQLAVGAALIVLEAVATVRLIG